MVEVLWEEDAIEAFGNAFEYYKRNMGDRAAQKFRDKMVRCVEHISNNHLIGKVEECFSGVGQEVRVLVVHKRYRIIYFVEGNVPTIAFIQNCKEEKRLKK